MKTRISDLLVVPYPIETELLTREENLVGLIAVNREVIGQAEAVDHLTRRLFGSMLQRIWALPVPTG